MRKYIERRNFQVVRTNYGRVVLKTKRPGRILNPGVFDSMTAAYNFVKKNYSFI